MKSGNITLLFGPVFAGKTTELIRQINRHRVKKQKICLIIPSCKLEKQEDIKRKFYFLENNILFAENIADVLKFQIFIDADVVAIDDLHFFTDSLIAVPLIADKLDKTVICAGLDNDSNRQYYKNVLDLIPKSETVMKLSAFCSDRKDGSLGIFSKKEGEQYLASSRKACIGKDEVGYLHIITGPMFSGKTTELIRIANQYNSIGKKVLAINYSKDTRYDEEANIFSHDKQKFEKNLALDNFDNFIEKYDELIKESDVILVDEIQFFKDCFTVVKSLVEDLNKIVILGGLDGDYLQNPFGDICKLIAFSDKLTRLNALCSLGNFQDAPFTRRIAKSDQTEFIGSDDSYIACCRQIYNLSDKDFLEKLLDQKEETK